MPELPEVENIVRGLRPLLVERTVSGVEVLWPRTIAAPSAAAFASLVTDRRIVSVDRRGKYVMLALDVGWLLFHLKMSGRLRWGMACERPGPYTRLTLELDDGHRLRFDDPRKFGRAYWVDDPDEITGRLGPEPLREGFGPEEFRFRLSRRLGRLKPLLLNQQFLAGVGNIYADEVLFRARLHPLRRAGSLDTDEQDRLYGALRCVLHQAIAGHGTTLDDGGYVDSRGESGHYQNEIAVYGRKGKPCLGCGQPIQRILIGQRSAHFCPRCQPDRHEP